MVGGLLAVVWTKSIQTVLLLVGAVVVTIVGYVKDRRMDRTCPHSCPHNRIRWRASRTAKSPGAPAIFCTWHAPAVIRPGFHCIPFCSAILFSASGIGVATRPSFVTRVLAAKSEKDARLGPLFCAFLKIWPVFIFVLPGVICVALVQKGLFGGAAPLTATDTYTFLITHLLPVGLKGLVAAAMLAAAMQTCSAALNSTATLVAYDIFKRRRPSLNDS